MTRRAALNLGLLLGVAILVLIVYFQPGVKRETPLPHLTNLAPAEVKHVFIHQSSGLEVQLSRTDDTWMIDSPIHAYANEFRLEPLLRVAEAESYATFGVQGQDLKKYRLDPPLATLRVDDVELAFGGTEPINNRRYVRIGDTIHLIDDQYYFRLQTDLPGFVSNRLLPPNGRPVAIRAPDFTLSRDSAGRWTATPASKASADTLNALVDEWKQVQAVDVDRYQGGGKVLGTVKIEFEPGMDAVEFERLQSASDVVLARKDLGLRYHLTTDQAHRLLSLPSAPSSP
jgi:hypothetical protein